MYCIKLCLILLLLFLVSPWSALADAPLYPSANERLGFGVTQGIQNYDVSPLKAGWYVNWGTAPEAAHPAGLDFAQIIRVSNAGYHPSGSQLNAIIERDPGALWLIGNEPDCPYQDNTLPDNYIRIYHDAYHAIKGQDPTARIAIGGIVQATPLRMQWLDLVWNGYAARYGETMPVDVWNIHNFVLNEARVGYGGTCDPPRSEWGSGIPPGLSANCGMMVAVDQLDDMSLFRQQIIRFRTWMRDHGQRNKPLIISEYGILFNEELGYTYPRVRDYMLETFDYLLTARDIDLGYPADDYHLVQRWAWYSLDDTSFGWGTTHGALMDPDKNQLTSLGVDFALYAAALITPYVDLKPAGLRVSTPAPILYGQKGIVRLSVDVENLGNNAAKTSRVAFWLGDPDQDGMKLGTVGLSTVPSRYAGMATAALDWSIPALGSYHFTAVVDPAGQVPEADESNNRITVPVDFGTVNLAVTDVSWQVIRGPLRAGEATEIALGPATIMATQVESSTPGLEIVPPPLTAIWYDGDPAAGGSVIAAQPVAAPTAFGQEIVLPVQSWEPRITAARSAWLVVWPQNGAPETNSADNHVVITVPATVDLTLSQVRQTAVPLSQPGDLRDVSLRFKVANLGAVAPAGPVQVAVWPGGQAAGPELGRVQLAATGDWTDPLDWTGLDVGAHPFVARVDPENATDETSETNNELVGRAIVAAERTQMPLVLR